MNRSKPGPVTSRTSDLGGVWTLSVSVLILLSLTPVSAATLNVATDATQNPASISEWSVAATGLMDLTCTDSTAAVITCTCSVTSTSPTPGPFNVQQLTGDNKQRIYYTGTGLSYKSASSYTVNVVCSDGTNKATTQGTVNVIENQAPVFTVWPSDTASSISAASAQVGNTVYTVTATDPEKNSITYSMTQDPNSGYFQINSGTGEITVAKSLLTLTATTVKLSIVASDITKSSGTFILNVPITNLNQRPLITNLPDTVSVHEDKAGGYVLSTLTITDPDGQTVTTTCSVKPADEAYKFLYNTNNQQIKLASLTTGETLLDYDLGTRQYLITCVASDGYLTSESDVLTVNVENVNEPPVFSQPMYYCTLTESDIGVSQCSLGLSATDPENQAMTYSLLPGNNSERFTYLTSTNRLTFAVNYDVDNSAMPTKVIVTIQAKDAQGLTGTSQITINVQDANDNTCNFGNGVQTASVNQGTSLGTLGTFYATDDDLTSPNNDVRFETVSGDTSYLYLFSNGQVQYSKQIPESESGRTFYLQVRCVDKGSPALSATATFALTYVTTTSTTTTTTTTTTTATPVTTTTTASSSHSVWDDDAFVAVFAMLMLLLALGLVALLAYLCCCSGGGCASGGGCFDGCCYPQQRQPLMRVHPAQKDFFRTERSGKPYSDYKDFAWNNGDSIEDGTWGGNKASNSPLRISSSRALPAPRDGY